MRCLLESLASEIGKRLSRAGAVLGVRPRFVA